MKVKPESYPSRSMADFRRGTVTFLQMSLSLLVMRMNLLLPPSSAFSAMVACPAVPDPAKKSRMTESLADATLISSRMRATGLGVEKQPLSPSSSHISSLADDVVP